MRISTSTIYDNQTASIDNLETEYQTLGNQLSSGISFNAPADDPTIVGQDLTLRTTLATEAQTTSNVTGATNELTATDSALASLTSVIQSARTLAVQAASGTNTAADRQDIAAQVQQLQQQAVSIANTQYDGTYIFAGTADPTVAPVTATGNPITGVTINANQASQGQLLDNGQSVTLSTSLQAAFNVDAADGSPDVFTTLQNLVNPLNSGDFTDESATAVNQPGTYITTGAAPATATTLGAAQLAVPLVADNSTPPIQTPAPTPPAAQPTKNYSIQINSTTPAGVQSIETYTFTDQTAIDDGTGSSVVGQINANSATTGLTASFDAKTQRLSLSSTGGTTFYVTDVPTPAAAASAGPPATTAEPAATTSGNFVEAFGLAGTADVATALSTQLNDIDNALNVTLNSRAVVGASINTLSAISSQLSTQSTDNTSVKSGLEDVNVASATSQFTETETALQAAFETTTRLEGKTLFDYIS